MIKLEEHKSSKTNLYSTCRKVQFFNTGGCNTITCEIGSEAHTSTCSLSNNKAPQCDILDCFQTQVKICWLNRRKKINPAGYHECLVTDCINESSISAIVMVYDPWCNGSWFFIIIWILRDFSFHSRNLLWEVFYPLWWSLFYVPCPPEKIHFF